MARPASSSASLGLEGLPGLPAIRDSLDDDATGDANAIDLDRMPAGAGRRVLKAVMDATEAV